MVVNKKRCVAMLLAGGQGSRLGVLTKYRAKPAVPYGGKYRIIDFPLSNCANSGIDTVGVLTQYQPLELNTYIGTGAPWDLDSITGGAFVLPPYVRSGKPGEWYSGTANAIYQNLYFIERYSPEYVLVLSGDHIYKMDYTEMIRFHEQKGADTTIAVLRVPLSEASRFGILNTDEELRIVEFDEKPKQPKNDLASMGIYVFNWQKLKRYLQEDARNSASSHDFGKDVLPAMLAGGERMFAYRFDGYWKDVGTVESLWEANMELLTENPGIRLRDPEWRIYARNPNQPPHYAGDHAEITTSMISEGCYIYGTVRNCVLFSGVIVKEGAEITDSVIMQDTVIERNAVVRRAIIDERAYIGEGAVVGGMEQITVVGSRAQIAPASRVAEGARIEPVGELAAKGGDAE